METLRGTLAAAETVLRTRGAADSSPHGAAIQRSCVVLCATAWEVYAEDSILWLADRVQKSVRADCIDLPEPLASVFGAAQDELAAGFRKAGRWEVEAQKTADLEWMQALAPHDLLGAALRLRVFGPYQLDGKRRFREAMGQPYVHVVREMQKATYGESFIDQVRVGDEPASYVPDSIAQLLEVRNASVHRGETPGPLDRRGARSWIEFVGDLADSLDSLIHRWADKKLKLAEHIERLDD
jgi:hypothetical protein